MNRGSGELPFRGLHSTFQERRAAAFAQIARYVDDPTLTALRRQVAADVEALQSLGYPAGVIVFESFRKLGAAGRPDLAGIRVTVGAGAVPASGGRP